MKPLHVVLSASLAVALAGCHPSKPAVATSAPATETAAAEPAANPVDPAAVDALKRMSAYLGTLKTFEVKGNTSVELVMDDGDKSVVDGTVRYLVQRPDGFVIDVDTENKTRRFIYNGKTLTVEAPKLGYYATVAAPPTIRETLDAANDKYDIKLPIEDLFLWSDPDRARTDDLESATVMGTATVDGVACDHYAFHEDGIDWQIWIAQGDKPAPRKIIIADSEDPSHPEFVARLAWNTAPQITANSFAFTASKNAKAIRIAAR